MLTSLHCFNERLSRGIKIEEEGTLLFTTRTHICLLKISKTTTEWVGLFQATKGRKRRSRGLMIAVDEHWAGMAEICFEEIFWDFADAVVVLVAKRWGRSRLPVLLNYGIYAWRIGWSSNVRYVLHLEVCFQWESVRWFGSCWIGFSSLGNTHLCVVADSLLEEVAVSEREQKTESALLIPIQCLTACHSMEPR